MQARFQRGSVQIDCYQLISFTMPTLLWYGSLVTGGVGESNFFRQSPSCIFTDGVVIDVAVDQLHRGTVMGLAASDIGIASLYVTTIFPVLIVLMTMTM